MQASINDLNHAHVFFIARIFKIFLVEGWCEPDDFRFIVFEHLFLEIMDFFTSISTIFRIWQFICLSPFVLKKDQQNSISKNLRRISSLAVILIQVILMVLSLVFLNQIVNKKRAKTIRIVDTITMLMVQLTTLVIFCEAYRKRFVQKELLHTINSIDFILEYKLGIIQNHKKQKNKYERRLFYWLSLSVSIFIANLVVTYHSFEILYRWWILVYASFFICSMRCYQIITYVDIIRNRYRQINSYIDNLQFCEQKLDVEDVNHVKFQNTVCTQIQTNQTTCIYDRLLDLRRVCRLMSSANQNINQMFQWSIALIVVNDFVHIMVNLYWILRIILSPKAPIIFAVPPLLWTILNIKQVVSLSSACHYTIKEVFCMFSYHFYFFVNEHKILCRVKVWQAFSTNWASAIVMQHSVTWFPFN